jgi:hypothetical protein
MDIQLVSSAKHSTKEHSVARSKRSDSDLLAAKDQVDSVEESDEMQFRRSQELLLQSALSLSVYCSTEHNDNLSLLFILNRI